jgi:hypothetical protein
MIKDVELVGPTKMGVHLPKSMPGMRIKRPPAGNNVLELLGAIIESDVMQNIVEFIESSSFEEILIVFSREKGFKRKKLSSRRYP